LWNSEPLYTIVPACHKRLPPHQMLQAAMGKKCKKSSNRANLNLPVVSQ
jgi:hypothetical protein